MSNSEKTVNGNPTRPVYLSLTDFKFPITAIVSIFHRVSGVFLAVGLIPAIIMWHTSLDSATGFQIVITWLDILPVKLSVWFYLSCLWFHALAGIKHLFMDLGWGEHLSTASRLSWGAIIVSFLFSGGLLYLLIFI